MTIMVSKPSSLYHDRYMCVYHELIALYPKLFTNGDGIKTTMGGGIGGRGGGGSLNCAGIDK